MRKWFAGCMFVALLHVGPAPPPAIAAEGGGATAEGGGATQTFDLSIDNIMRGPNLYGYSPAEVWWTPDSARVYFSWKQWNDPLEKDRDTYVVNRDGSGLRNVGSKRMRNCRRRTFPPLVLTYPRINGGLGLNVNYDMSTWRLRIEGVGPAPSPASAAEGGGATATLTLDDIKSLPRHDIIAEPRCIEGWSFVVHWTGARLADLMAKLPPPRGTRYVAMETPDRGYYVGLDMQSAMHPQTLLAYALNDQPLTWQHGAPLRLAIPVKHGIKNIKRIGTIRYTDVRPADYWAEREYDWYSGH